jgi:PTS system nitrogen regulatory IIA component
MPYTDFTVERLAAYLHLSPAQVARLADRGKIPGRKVSGQWRFSRAEIHNWLEQRIGLSDEEELAQVEAALRGAASPDDLQLPFADLLPPAAVAVPLAARTRNSVITSMADLAAGTGLLWDAAKMAEAVRAREDMQPTALDNGVALLHPRRPMPEILAQPLLALGRTDGGIPFGASHGALTDLFFLIGSTDDRGHLRTLARLSRIVADGATLDAARNAPDAQSLRRVILDREARIDA